MQKVSIYIFEQHIADMYQDDDRVYLKQIDDICHKVSALMLNSNQKVQEAAEIIILKNRDGETGTAHVGFEGVYVRFVEKEILPPLVIEFE